MTTAVTDRNQGHVIEVPVVNVSSDTIQPYMVVAVGKLGGLWTSTGDVNAALPYGTPLPCAATTIGNQTNAFGILQGSAIGPGKVGIVRRLGHSFVRVGGATLAMGDRGATNTVIGAVVVTVSDNSAVFYCQITASTTIVDKNGIPYGTWTVSHAFGECDFVSTHRF